MSVDAMAGLLVALTGLVTALASLWRAVRPDDAQEPGEAPQEA